MTNKNLLWKIITHSTHHSFCPANKLWEQTPVQYLKNTETKNHNWSKSCFAYEQDCNKAFIRNEEFFILTYNRMDVSSWMSGSRYLFVELNLPLYPVADTSSSQVTERNKSQLVSERNIFVTWRYTLEKSQTSGYHISTDNIWQG